MTGQIEPSGKIHLMHFPFSEGISIALRTGSFFTTNLEKTQHFKNTFGFPAKKTDITGRHSLTKLPFHTVVGKEITTAFFLKKIW